MVKTKIIQEELEVRKKVERAKGVLMRQRGISEEAAYSLIQRSSMDRRLPMKDVAEAIILADDIQKEK